MNTPETITAMCLGAACYLTTLGTAWKALRAVEARLRLVAPAKAPVQPAAEEGTAAGVEELGKRRAAS